MRWGVLGGSARIYHSALAPVLADLDGHEVVALASRRGDDESPYAELLARTDLDAVYIPLPNHLHATWIVRALEAGKHVLCEKPLTMTVADTDRCFDAAAATGCTLIEAYMWPHHPRSQLLLALAAAGDLGSLRSCHGTFSFHLARSGDHRVDARGGGAMFDIGIYCIAPAMLLAGRDPVGISAAATNNDAGVDVAMTGLVDYGSGFAGTFSVSFEAAGRRSVDVVGSGARVSFSDSAVSHPDEPTFLEVVRPDGSVEQHPFAPANAYATMVEQFTAVTHGDAQPLFGPEHSRRLARIQAALLDATRP
jgi:D-xylose 1-dehydrogenase (NADP+, D-xylono-1,5-lactone-forming)